MNTNLYFLLNWFKRKSTTRQICLILPFIHTLILFSTKFFFLVHWIRGYAPLNDLNSGTLDSDIWLNAILQNIFTHQLYFFFFCCLNGLIWFIWKSITNKKIIVEIMILWIRFRQILLSVFIHLLQFSRAVCSKMSVPPSTSPPPFRYSILLCIRNSIPVPFMFHPFFWISWFLGYSQNSISGASGAKI